MQESTRNNIFSKTYFKQKGAKWHCIIPVRSYSHILDKETFDNWNEVVNLVKFKRIDERNFEMNIGIPPLENKDELYHKAIIYTYTTLMALNVSTLGHFWWTPPIWPFKIPKVYDIDSEQEVKFKINVKKDREWGDGKLTQKDLNNAMILVIGQLDLLDETFFEFYALAMTLLSASNLEHQFYREIFSNFYKIIERLTVIKVLCVKKLNSEKSQIKKAMEKLGMDKDIISEFDEIYKIRSRDAMHSWGEEVPITFEEVGKCKILCDYMLHKYLKNEVERRMKETVKEN